MHGIIRLHRKVSQSMPIRQTVLSGKVRRPIIFCFSLVLGKCSGLNLVVRPPCPLLIIYCIFLSYG